MKLFSCDAKEINKPLDMVKEITENVSPCDLLWTMGTKRSISRKDCERKAQTTIDMSGQYNAQNYYVVR